MPLSRQTSRIVWPSKPSTTRPSTSIRMRGDDCGRCGACVSSSRSASDAIGRRSIAGRLSGRVIEVGHGSPYRVAPAATAIGWQTPAGQAAARMCSSSSDRKYRIPLVSGRVVRRSWSHRAEADDVGRQVRQQGHVGRPRAAVDDAGPRSRRAGASRSGTGWSCRTPRRRRTGSAAGPGRRRTRGRRRRRPSPSRCGRRPRGAARSRTACRAASGGSSPPDGPPTRTALTLRPAGSLPPSSTTVAQRRPERHLGDAVAAPASATWTRTVPGLSGGAGRHERLRRRGGRSSGTAASVWTLWTTGGHRRTGRARRDAAAAARAGRACPRGP